MESIPELTALLTLATKTMLLWAVFSTKLTVEKEDKESYLSKKRKQPD